MEKSEYASVISIDRGSFRLGRLGGGVLSGAGCPMQNIVIDKPYAFIGPKFSCFWLWVVRKMTPKQLKNDYGVITHECRGVEKLKASLAAGHGIMLVSNHSRPCDPLVMDYLAQAMDRPIHTIASWHLFMQGKIQRFLLPRIGCMSVYREGMDRESLKCATKVVADAEYPLVIFTEGIVTRGNDRLLNFMEGPSFLARAAMKQRPEGKVVIHPIFIRYFFEGDLRKTVTPVVEDIENRLSWQHQTQLSLKDRITKVGHALLGLKEIEHLGRIGEGNVPERIQHLIDHILTPLEDRWINGRKDDETMARVKRLRSAILPELIGKELAEEERAERWRYLENLYLVQQLHCYSGDYLQSPTPERILETVERYEEDLTDVSRAHPPLHVVITVGDAIEVSAERHRSQEGDPIMLQIRERMEAMLEETKSLRRKAPTGIDFQ
jgi:1-acyl-sn-glycerol-3-phosphate acyltransferase